MRHGKTRLNTFLSSLMRWRPKYLTQIGKLKMISLAYVAVVDKLYDIMKSENRKTIPFKFIGLFVLKEFVKKCAKNAKFLQYLSEKVCNKLAKWCAEGRNSDDGATLFYSDASENGNLYSNRKGLVKNVLQTIITMF